MLTVKTRFDDVLHSPVLSARFLRHARAEFSAGRLSAPAVQAFIFMLRRWSSNFVVNYRSDGETWRHLKRVVRTRARKSRLLVGSLLIAMETLGRETGALPA